MQIHSHLLCSAFSGAVPLFSSAADETPDRLFPLPLDPLQLHILRQDQIQQDRYDKHHSYHIGGKYGLDHLRKYPPQVDLTGRSKTDAHRERQGGDGHVPLEIGQWTKPQGGYFVSFDALDGCAKAIVAKCKEAGVVMTGAGATFPYGKDPHDSNIRIAPSFPSLEDLKLAAEIFCVCVKLVSIDKLLEA